MDLYDQAKFKRARIYLMTDLKKKQLEVRQTVRNEQRTIERINRDLEEQKQRILEIQKILEDKQKELEGEKEETQSSF